MDPLIVKTFTADHTLDAADHFCMLHYTAKANLLIEAGAYPPGFMCFVVCPPPLVECGALEPARGVVVNGYRGPSAARSFVPGLNILVQPEIDNWTMGLAQIG